MSNSDQRNTEPTIQTLVEKMDAFSQSLGSLRQDVVEFRQEMGAFRQSVEKRLTAIEESVESIDTRQDKYESIVLGLPGDFKGFRTQVRELIPGLKS